jgi:peptidoglycan hydrolase-like protein with peptidoglycan-binding domain
MLRARLGLDPDGPFDAEVARALRDFQGAHGLPRDALAGPLTLAALNGGGSGSGLSPDQRRTLQINLARAHGLPAEPPSRYILVDAAAARLWTYENGRVRDSMRVVVGRVTDQTPMIAGMIRYATLNPYWNVPPDLVASRIAPNVLDDGMPYLRGRGLRGPHRLVEQSGIGRSRDDRLGGGRGRAEGNPGAPATRAVECDGADEVPVPQQSRRLSPRHARARPAARDGPAVQRRLRPRRGCAAAGALAVRPNADRAFTGPEQQVPLPQPVAVYITYLTAAPDGDRIAFREDVYWPRQRPAAPVGGAKAAVPLIRCSRHGASHQLWIDQMRRPLTKSVVGWPSASRYGSNRARS